MKRAFIIAAFGDRQENVRRLCNNIRSFVDWPILIVTDSIEQNMPKGIILPRDKIFMEEVERMWPKGSYNEGRRNSNYFKIDFAIKNHDVSLCLLDDDMFIVHEGFTDGFGIAERFGAALPLNPRVYVKYNSMGADVSDKVLDSIQDTPLYAPACNYSPMFVYPHCGLTANFLQQLKNELIYRTCRVTLAIWIASWKSQFTPVYLPEQYCVCGSNAEHIKNYTKQLKGQEIKIPPIMLHLGHEQVKKVFNIED